MIMASHGRTTLSGKNLPTSIYYEQGKSGRMFPTLPLFAADNPFIPDFSIGKYSNESH